jgi:hypothetical protein
MRKIFLGFILISILISVSLCTVTFAQTSSSSLTGKVTDQTGAVIPQATVSVTGDDGKPVSATTDPGGGFAIPGLPAGTYSVAASAKGFAPLKKNGVTLSAGQSQSLNLALQIQTQPEKVEVQGEPGTQLDVSSSSGAGSLVIKGKDLEALSDDPDELQSELQALAGPSAGPNGGQIYIDGFTGGQLPPKSAIREIRVNQNPFSAQYDKLGYGRIEIFTKPGSDKYHGQFMFNDNNSIFNSRNPYVPTKPDYNSEIFDGNLGGPLGKKASFFLDAQRRNIDEFSAINAADPNSPNPQNPNYLQESIPNPRTRTNFSPRLDYQINTNNTLTARYQITHETSQDGGLSQFSLPSQAYNLNETEQTVQISDSQILNPKMVNETRFQFQRENTHQLPFSTATAIQVQGGFTGGGSSQGDVRTTQNNYELQNYTSIAHGKHFIKFGGRFRALNTSTSSNPNFNGTFVFSPVNSGGTTVDALSAYQSAAQGNCSQSGSVSCPTQFSLTTGTPLVSVNWVDAGLYAEDEWRIRPQLSLTYGLRFESQSDIHDHADFAPRLGIAWGLGSDGKSAPKTVLRGGFGIFYDRFGYNLVQQAERLDGVTQQSIVVQNPDFYTADPTMLPSFSQLQAISTASPTIYQIGTNLRAPYTMQEAASIERQVTKAATVSLTYLNSRGEHALFIRNINAPLNGVYPLPQYGNGNVYQYDSEGVFRQNQLIANVRVSVGKKVSLFGFYTLNYANSNAASGGGGGGFFGSGLTSSASFLSNSYDPMADYGRAAFDVRHRAFIGGSIEVPYGFRLSPFIIINSGQPFNITTGTDSNGDSIFNDRPALVSSTTCAKYTPVPNTTNVCTLLGTFNTVPAPGQAILPVNYDTGPGNATFNLRLSKTFSFGPEMKGAGGEQGHGGGPRGGYPGGGLGGRGLGGGGGNPFGGGTATNRHYNVTFSVAGRNILNSANPGAPVGNLSSTQNFGRSIAIAGGAFSSASANRRVDLQVMFSF